MKTPCWLVLLLVSLTLGACGNSPTSATEPPSVLETAAPATPVAALATSQASTIPPSPLEATLISLVAEHGGITATLPITVATLANTLILNDIAARESNENATATAWAALPLDMGTPTVPAPRPDGLDLADTLSWQRYVDATGFSFDYLVNEVVAPLEPVSGSPEMGGTTVVGPKEANESVAGPEVPIVVGMTRTGIDAIASPPLHDRSRGGKLVDAGTLQ